MGSTLPKRKAKGMTDRCAFSSGNVCLKQRGYQIIRMELEEADKLCHNNWLGIEYLLDRVEKMEGMIKQNGIEYDT